MTEEIKTISGLKLLIEKRRIDRQIEISLSTKSKKNCLLHWGLSPCIRMPWKVPPQIYWPEGTRPSGETALQTPFKKQNGENRILMRLDQSLDFSILDFVLFFPEEDLWDNNHGKNYQIKLQNSKSKASPQIKGLNDRIKEKKIRAESESSNYSCIVKVIIQYETESDSWTLMHRFNLCYDLLDMVENDVEGLALLFVWLRFSAIRQLTWQRNYNTQPRELSHALDRLTLRLSEIYIIAEPISREMIRLIFTTLGKGGEGQRIRDEFLNIMHRHKIKEVTGNFVEEWHQKLHNNATPDDIVICKAYLEFMRSDGDMNLFYKTLETGGITRERLKSFERPIVTDPEFYKDIKEELIHDFENYMKILKSVHSATDLESAMESVTNLLDENTNTNLNFIWSHRNDPLIPLVNLMEKITNARISLKNFPDKERNFNAIREVLFLDLSLEAYLRAIVERDFHLEIGRDELVELISMVLENLCLFHDDFEFSECLRHWKRLKDMSRFGKDWSLHAKSVLDRLMRAIGVFMDLYQGLIQPKAEYLGKAFHADSWTIDLFGEEVLRGRPIFILSMLIRKMDPVLRTAADLGNWQIISPGQGSGRIEVVDALKSIQGKTFSGPGVIVIADKITGDEEIPEGVSAIITPDVTDIVSHIAVRARNKHLLFATCYDHGMISHLKSLKGSIQELTVNSSGEVVIEEETGDKNKQEGSVRKVQKAIPVRPDLGFDAVLFEDFNDKLVGGKSNNLKRLKGKLPDWIHIPMSMALPFGVFERLLAEPRNKKIAERYKGLIPGIDENPKEILAQIRELLLKLEPTDKLISSLDKAMEKTGIKIPENLENVWMCIKRIWASKWNERAFLNRQAMGISHDALFMAVLIQEVIKSEYAFVIHTANPYSGNRNELYAELVLGLGETLVGNHPGRAMSFASPKDTPDPHVLAYPSKSKGLYGSGLIFRSDSNGEDLSGYAGAGLYDSVMLEPHREVPLDYTREPMLWNEDFRREILIPVVRIGSEIEKTFGGYPQDIEGVYSRGEYYVVQTRPQVGIKEKEA
ncbi:MAG: phosphohistidine-like domain-containing protein [bacterium]